MTGVFQEPIRRSSWLTMRITPQEREHLHLLAGREGVSVARLVRSALMALLIEDERKAVLWAIDKGWHALDEGFSFPRDQNRALLESAREKLS